MLANRRAGRVPVSARVRCHPGAVGRLEAAEQGLDFDSLTIAHRPEHRRVWTWISSYPHNCGSSACAFSRLI